MNCETVLLLDLGASRPVSEDLCRALAAAQEQGIQIQCESAASFDSELRDAEVRRILDRLEPELVFLLMPGGEPDAGAMASLFELLRVPTIIVTEATHPEQMLELLELGASDFISRPFNAPDILARFLRLLAEMRLSAAALADSDAAAQWFGYYLSTASTW